MCGNSGEIGVKIQKLAELASKLQSLEPLYDSAVEHAANYLGNDEGIEAARDARAISLLQEILAVKDEMKSLAQSLQDELANSRR